MKALHVQVMLAVAVMVGLLVRPTSATHCTIDEDYAIVGDTALGTAPCAGYLENGGQRFCGDFDDRAVERACWVAGESGAAHAVTGEVIRNYRCFQNTVDGEGHTGTNTYAVPAITGTAGHQCIGGGDQDCFADCYNAADGLSTACTVPKDFAISCTDRDECADGVLLDCDHPFAEDCPICKPCGPNTKCVNTDGGYECECLTGFGESPANSAYDIAVGCVPSDQCGVDDECPSTAVCLNTIESYLCFCPTVGYNWNDGASTCDIKSCGTPVGLVDAELQVNTDETYLSDHVYKCDYGYIPKAPSGAITIKCRGDGEWCHCATPECVKRPCGPVNMDPNACTEVEGSLFGDLVRHVCIDGFLANGDPEYTVECLGTGKWETASTSCKEEDECAGANDCDNYPNSECVNTVGSYHCVCHHGYEGATCAPISCGSIPVVPNADLTTDPVPADPTYGVILNYRCREGYRVAHRYSPDLDEYDFDIVCNLDKRWSPEPIPECIPVPCGDPGDIKYASREGTTFTYGSEVSYTCAEGFRPSDYDLQDDSTYKTFKIFCESSWLWTARPSCVHIDECVEYDNPCGGDKQYCIDLTGSYTCSCDTNYRIDHTGKSCIGFPITVEEVAKDPCEAYNSMGFCNFGECHVEESTNRPGCKCRPGFVGAFCEEQEHDLLGMEVTLGVIGCCIAGVALILCVVLTCYICSRHHYHKRQRKEKPAPVVYKPRPHFHPHHHHHGHRYAPSVWPFGSNHFPF